MANIVQMGVDEFYDQLGKVRAAGQDEINALNDQKQQLQDTYSSARVDGDSATMRALEPLIHQNSSLRLQARDYVARFNGLVKSTSALLQQAGFDVPEQLAGLGQAQVILIPVAVVAGLAILWAIINRLTAGREAIDKVLASQGPQLIAAAQDPSSTPAERAAAMQSYQKLLKDAGIPPGGDLFSGLVPVLGLVALIVVAPTLLKMLPHREAA